MERFEFVVRGTIHASDAAAARVLLEAQLKRIRAQGYAIYVEEVRKVR